MDCFDNFDPLTGDIPGYPFAELWGIVAEARFHLTGSSSDDIRDIERNLDNLIADAKAECAHIWLNDHVTKVIENGSWELDYLPNGTSATKQSVRYLLENWPDSAVEPDYLTEDDLSNVEALRMAVSMGDVGKLDFESSYPVKCAAVLALMNAADCLHSLGCSEDDLGTHEDGPIAARLLSAASYAIEAALALGYANELAAILESRLEAAEDLEETIEERQRRFIKDRAIKAATEKLRNDPKQKAKLQVHFAWKQWQSRPNMYPSKSAFANEILKQQPALINQRVIVDWCGIWEREKGGLNG